MIFCKDCRYFSSHQVCMNCKCDTAEGTNLVDGSSIPKMQRSCWGARMNLGPCGFEAIFFERILPVANRPASGVVNWPQNER